MPRKDRSLATRKHAQTLAVQDSAGGTLALRERMLALAGISDADQAQALRQSFDVLVRHLGYRKVQRLVVRDARDHEHVEEYQDEDASAQRSAAVALIELIGAMPSRSTQAVAVHGKQIVVTFAQPPQPVPASAVVVDASASPPDEGA